MPITLNPNADASGLGLGFDPPITDGLEAFFLFGGDITQSAKNHAPNKPNGVIVGSPVIGTGFARFQGDQSWLQTDVSDEIAMTIICIGRCTDAMTSAATRPSFAGNQTGNSISGLHTGGGAGVNIYQKSAGKLCLRAGAWSGSATVTGEVEVTADLAQWGYIESAFSTNLRKLRHRTQGAEIITTPSAARDPVNTKYRSGDVPSVTSGSVELNALAIFNRVLSNDEFDYMYPIMQSIAALSSRGGLTI